MTSAKILVPESVTFEEAIAITTSLIEQMEAGKLSEGEIEEAIASLVKTENGARGFFVTYLTMDGNIANQPSQAVVAALQSSPSIVSELLAKNIAMSTAMAITHRRNQDEEMAASSDQVCQRSINLTKKLQLQILTDKLKQLQESAISQKGNYQAFLERWGYDAEQKKVIAETISFCLHQQ